MLFASLRRQFELRTACCRGRWPNLNPTPDIRGIYFSYRRPAFGFYR